MAEVENREVDQQEQKEDAEAVPFFARFLEDQKRVRTGVKAGRLPYQTMKYPSDQEDGGGGGVKDPGFQTMKYPSDGDEA